MSKIERRNKARQLQQNKTRDAERESRIFKGKDAAPRIVAVVPLSDDVSGQATVQALLKSLDMQVEVPEVGQCITWWVTILKGLVEGVGLPLEQDRKIQAKDSVDHSWAGYATTP